MKLTRNRYQEGTVELRSRAGGAVWVYRYTVRNADGSSSRPSKPIGTLEKYPTKSAALKAAAYLRERANEGPGQVIEQVRTVSMVMDRFIAEDLSTRYSTRRSSTSWIENHLRPKFGARPIAEVKANEVKLWLGSLPLAPKSKSHLRGLMGQFFNAAMLWEWIPADRNPMELFRVKDASKRMRKPIILSPEQFAAILSKIDAEPFRTMVLTAMCIGPRRSEFIALKWCDFDWQRKELLIRRGIVDGRIGPVKTDYSEAGMPLDPDFAEILERWRGTTRFKEEDDWVFASPFSGGEMPYWPSNIGVKYLREPAMKLGLGRVGWHSLRHTYRHWLDDAGAPVSVQQWLMRHSDIRTTMNIYGRSMPSGMREMNSKVVRMALPERKLG